MHSQILSCVESYYKPVILPYALHNTETSSSLGMYRDGMYFSSTLGIRVFTSRLNHVFSTLDASLHQRKWGVGREEKKNKQTKPQNKLSLYNFIFAGSAKKFQCFRTALQQFADHFTNSVPLFRGLECLHFTRHRGNANLSPHPYNHTVPLLCPHLMNCCT